MGLVGGASAQPAAASCVDQLSLVHGVDRAAVIWAKQRLLPLLVMLAVPARVRAGMPGARVRCTSG